MAASEFSPIVLPSWPQCLQAHALLLVVTAILSCCCLSTSDGWKRQLHETALPTAQDAHSSAGSTAHSTLHSSLQNYRGSSSMLSSRHKTDNTPSTQLSTLQRHSSSNNNSSSSSSSSSSTLDSGYRADNLSQQLVWLQRAGLCPGAADRFVQRTVQQVFRVTVPNCWHLPHDLWSQRAVLYGVCSNTSTFCRFPVQTPRGKTVHVSTRPLLSTDGKHHWRTDIHDSWSGNGSWPEIVYSKMSGMKLEFLSTTNHMYVSHHNKPALHMNFAVYNQSFDTVYTATHSGYVTLSLPTHGYSWKEPELHSQLEVPPGHVAMVSFEAFHSRNPSCLRYVELGFQELGKSRESVSRILSDTERSVHVLHTAQIHLRARLGQERSNISCLKMLFSFHSKSRAPQRSGEGLFNCSTEDYPSFQQHLHCNARLQCEDGRDETAQCPFSNAACNGLVASRHKCYLYVSMSSKLTPEGAMSECFARGMELASITSEQELRDFEILFRNQDVENIYTGLTSGWSSLPWMYTKFFYWSSSTMIYFMNHLTVDLMLLLMNSRALEQYAYVGENPHYSAMHALERRSHHFVCEKYLQPKETFSAQSIETLPVPNITQVWQELVSCPDRHTIHAFLSCDHKSECGNTPCLFVNQTSSVTAVQPVQHVTLFTSSREAAPISYSLVCDFRADCPDQSDESFCQHPPCHGFLCTIGQCVPETEECDGYSGCLDDSDERECYDYDEGKKIEKRAKAQPYLFNLDGRGYFIYEVINKSESCPATHYRCTTEQTDCLPVYTRCNGVYDCIYHEDEKDCDRFMCPGFFHCRDSTVCVHAEHLCDGWPQCPQRDDEWLCNQTCPTVCLCQGHAFLCPRPFQAGLFPQLRSLDARQSGMTPLDLANNTYLVHVSLAHCSIHHLSSHVLLPNVQIMDLGHNKLSTLLVNVFVGMKNLRHLSLKDNPLVSLTRDSSNLEQHTLIKLDLSLSYLEDFNNEIISNFRDIQNINLSFSNLRTIGPQGFQASRHLKQLDIRGNVISEFPQNLFQGLDELEMVYSSNYRLCCDSVLPYSAREIVCLAPEQVISSCEHLLFLDSHRLWYWLVSILSTTGNVCLIGILLLKKTPRNAFSVLVGNLHCAHVWTGVYASVIIAVHETLHGQYLQHEKTWTNSSFCKGAGFMSLLSSEASILILCLVTLDQVMCVCFPSSPYRLNKRSAAVACAVAWLVGLTLASVPLLPVPSHCGRYGQTAVCGLMLHSPRCSREPGRFFLATVTFNCVACLWLCGGLLSVRRALPRHRVLADPGQRTVRAAAGLCSKLTVAQAASCLSITAATVTALGGQAESQQGEVTMAVFMWPLSAALTPLLCLWHTLADRRRQQQEDRLLRVFKARLKSDRALT